MITFVLIQKMKFIVPGVSVKHLGKAIHCLAKIGDEVYFELESEALILRTVNISRYPDIVKHKTKTFLP